MKNRARDIIIAGAVLLLLGGITHAADKKRDKAYPHYWISVDTVNQSIPGMSEEMAGMAGMFGGKGPAFGPRRELRLQLESPRAMPAKPEAAHDIPPGQDMGKSLLLVTPPMPEKMPDHYEGYSKPEKPEQMEKQKGRMLIYWGCGDSIGKGQPKILDPAKSKPEEMAKFFSGRTPTVQIAPSPRKGWVYGDWPNNEERKEIPKDSSLAGEHLIHGNYLPDIRFSLDKKRDFMAPVEFTSIQSTPEGVTKVEWKEIPTAIGYFATAMAQDQKSGDTIFWSASEVPESGFALLNYLTHGDVSRFIKEKVVMEPSRTNCIVPPIFKDTQGAMLQFIAYGEQLDIVHPPRPKDPKQAWEPQWSLKVRLKSTSMTPLMAFGEESGRRSKPGKKGKKPAKPQNEEETGQSQQSDEDSDSGRSKGGLGNRLRGMFGL